MKISPNTQHDLLRIGVYFKTSVLGFRMQAPLLVQMGLVKKHEPTAPCVRWRFGI